MSLNFTINNTKNMLSNTGGIASAAKIFQTIGLCFEGDTILSSSEKSVLSILAGFLVHGRTSFAETDLVRNDILFHKTLDLSFIYAPETIRIYLERMTDKHRGHILSLLNKSNPVLFRLDSGNDTFDNFLTIMLLPVYKYYFFTL